ncbi:hypothetical protein A4D02_00040 [Niastella koreensis]|uniref:Uncharacterized protein n=2 Tax=Niastella koreensis TaxID=354356 RepID=G8TA03_NIAKG|nr:hypothetical protein [Niastella koreensis]AEW02375.1 hypothetical protein Niako_6150 [Niastella koreensis GR20-10]OQP54754.1 hypothetical protein A4D02_00040 [Niastella koreensis]
MDNNSDQYYLSRALEQIETLFNRGASDNWTTYDFEKLSDAIFDRTQVRLSVTTLKRIWGKLKYDSAPTLTTLNTLAQFAGFVDWRDFKQNEDRPVPGPETNTVNPTRSQRNVKRLSITLAGALVLIAGVYFLFLAARHKQRQYDPGQFEFTTNKMISEGVPNSVIFHYTAKVKPDSLFIVQTWDIRRKTLVSADKHNHSAIYYYPGFFRTKLIADGQVMKKHDVWITSKGWLCLLEKEPIPVYFKKELCEKNGIVEVNDSLLTPYRSASTDAKVRFFNQRDLGDLMNDNFTFETMVKNDFDDGSNACHYAQVLIQCKDDIIIIPLAAKSCVGNLNFYFCGAGAESKFADLSGFGCDLTQWTRLRVETVNKMATIYVNNKKAYTVKFPNDPTGIVGVQYRFNGAAAVKETRFTSREKVWEMD